MIKSFAIQVKITYYLVILTCALLLPKNNIYSNNPVTFIITKVPVYTPSEDTLYLVSSLDNWKLKDPAKRFRLYRDGNYRLTIDIGDNKHFEYKINRGNWDKVEGNKWGDYLGNRRFTYYDTIYEVRLTIESWQDLHDTEYPSIQVIVMSVPENTPHDASIYMAGTFNNWMNNDPAYKLMKRDDGTYIGEIQPGLDSIYYKFTRGTWESTEGRWDGGMRSNREYITKRSSFNQVVANIRSWTDLSSGMLWLKVLFLTLLIQSIIVLGFLLRHINSILLIFINVLVSLAFLALFFYSNYSLLYTFPHGYFFPAIIYPFIGPWLYYWFRSNIKNEKMGVSYIHFLPLLPAIWYVQYFWVPTHTFYLRVVNNELVGFFFASYSYALLINLFFNYQLKKLITRQIAEISDLKYRFYKAIQNNWYFSALLVLIGVISIWQEAEIKFIVDWVENFIWIGIGVVIIYFGWFFISSLYAASVKSKSKTGKETIEEDSWIRFKGKLTELMIEKAVYANPNLTLSDLAGYLGTNIHYVSKLINEGFQKSYTDYINTYRVEAFIEAMKRDKDNNTFLYHALKVGFNSKSAFNRAFKKITGTTPSEYFTERD